MSVKLAVLTVLLCQLQLDNGHALKKKRKKVMHPQMAQPTKGVTLSNSIITGIFTFLAKQLGFSASGEGHALAPVCYVLQ